MKYLVLLGLFVVFGLSGCGGGDDAGMDSGSSQPSKPSSAAGTESQGNAGEPDSVSPPPSGN